jgi:electron transfer flavoprotein beta subunit
VKIVVCVKEIPNPEIASSVFRVDEAAKKVVPLTGLALVMSPFDAQAIEAALRIKEAVAETSITLLTLGPESARTTIRNGLSLGADEAVLLADPTFEEGDSYTTARVLASAIRKIGDCDLVLTDRQAADSDCGVVGCGIAELLDLPVVTYARRIEVRDGRVIVERVLEDGFETVEAALPAVVTISHELGAVRPASLRETMKTARKPQAIWTAADIGLEPSEIGAGGARRRLERLYIPVNDVVCEFLDGESATEQAAGLVDRLANARLI